MIWMKIFFLALICAFTMSACTENRTQSKIQKSASKSDFREKSQPESLPSGGLTSGMENLSTLKDEKPNKMSVDFPSNWPQEIPVMQGFELVNVSQNPVGGIRLALEGKSSIEKVKEFYNEKMRGWNSTEPIIDPEFEGLGIRMNFFKDRNTAQIEIIPDPVTENISLNLYYNWVTLPGELPVGWPADIPIMDGLTIVGGSIDSEDGLSVYASGEIALQKVAEHYSMLLSGWNKVGASQFPDIQDGTLILTFERDQKRLVILGYEGKPRNSIVFSLMLRQSQENGLKPNR